MHSSTAQIVERLRAATKRPFLVAIDGAGGAGKSTLAAVLQRLVPTVEVVHKDDFYQVMDEAVRAALDPQQAYQQNFDWQRLEQQVLSPLARGEPAHYERYDWVKNELAETLEVGAANIVIVEGVSSARPELREYYDLRIWVETSDAVRIKRMHDRGENSQQQIDRWEATEKYYADSFQPARAADIIVSGE